MNNFDVEPQENVAVKFDCEDQSCISEIEEVYENTYNKKTKLRKLFLWIGIIVIACTLFVIGRHLYNNGEVTNRTITLNIDLRDIKGKYTGIIKDGLPAGDGKFIYTIGGKKVSYTGTFSDGKFLNGIGSLVDNHGKTVYSGKFENGLPDEDILKNGAKAVTGYSITAWATDENLFKCYNQTGTITQVNRWAGTDNGVCLTVVTGGNNNGKAIHMFYENSENMIFYEGNLVNWTGRLVYVENGEYPQVIAYFAETFTETALRQQIYDSILNTLR